MRLKLPSPAQRRTRAVRAATSFARDRLTPEEVRERGTLQWLDGYDAALRDVHKALKARPR